MTRPGSDRPTRLLRWKPGLLLPAVIAVSAACTATDDGSLVWMDSPRASQPAFYMQEPYEKLRASLAACSRETGYTKQVADTSGPNQIPSSEIQWRSCAYESLHKTILPATKHPELYTSLIEEDRAMTQQVAAGRMTRAQRRQRLDAAIARIKEREHAELIKASPSARDEQLERRSMSAINEVMEPLR